MLEAENRRKSQEVIQLQVRGAQGAQQQQQQQQQSQQEVLQMQRLATEAEAAHDGARREVGELSSRQRRHQCCLKGWGPGPPGLTLAHMHSMSPHAHLSYFPARLDAARVKGQGL